MSETLRGKLETDYPEPCMTLRTKRTLKELKVETPYNIRIHGIRIQGSTPYRIGIHSITL